MSVRVFAPAKINLTLKVGRPRADGMHPLASVVVFADVGDWIEAERTPDRELVVTGPFARDLDGGDNIVLKAMAALGEAGGVRSGARVTLEKSLPIASGIGGGSSDAAAVLKALNVIWELGFGVERLASIARPLGGDVPVCVAAQSAFMTGVGERCAPLPLPALHAVLVNPLKPLSTPLVYRQFDAMDRGAPALDENPPNWRTAEEAIAGAALLGNDLAEPAHALMPAIGIVESALRSDSRVRYVALSGSGATVFALLNTRAEAEDMAEKLRQNHASWWVRATTLGAQLDPPPTAR